MADFRLGIQSYCFREFRTIDQLIGLVKKTGLSGVELFPGHIAPDAGDDEIRRTRERFEKEKIKIESCGVYNFSSNAQENKKIFKFATMMGVKIISADIEPDAIKLVENQCIDFNIKLAIHNHGRNHRYGTVKQLKELFSKANSSLGLCLDTAWVLDAGEDPVKCIGTFRERILGMHLKDFKFSEDGKPVDVITGDGGVKLEPLFQALKEINFWGFLSLEYEGSPQDPLPEIIKCVQKVKGVLGQ